MQQRQPRALDVGAGKSSWQLQATGHFLTLLCARRIDEIFATLVSAGVSIFGSVIILMSLHYGRGPRMIPHSDVLMYHAMDVDCGPSIYLQPAVYKTQSDFR